MGISVWTVQLGGTKDVCAVIHADTKMKSRKNPRRLQNKAKVLKFSTMVCLRRGYGGCTCQDCLPWVRKWNRETEGWKLIDFMLNGGDSLYHIYERLQCDFPEMLQHYKSIERKFIERCIENVDLLSNSSENKDEES